MRENVFEQHQQTWSVKEIYICGFIVPVCGSFIVDSLFIVAPFLWEFCV